MADINTTINSITGKSFTELKQRHIDFVSGTDQFKDFNFQGSRLNVLMSALAFSSYYMQAYANFSLRESFLQTCRTLSNGIIASQNIGYIPRGVRASRDEIQVTVTDDQARTFLTLPRGTVFSGTVNGETYLFTTDEDVTEERLTDGTYIFRLPITQGQRVSRFREITDSQKEFVIRDNRIDTSTMKVFVEGTEWTYFDNSLDSNPVSQSWYFRFNEDQFPIVYFGLGSTDGANESGFGGLTPPNGSEIEIEYVRTDEEQANGSRNYQIVTGFNDIDFVSITENPDADPNYIGSTGGAPFQTLESIKSNAPLFKQAYGNLVTALDYETVIDRQFGNFISSVRVSGNSNNPGFAFINIKPTQGLSLAPSIRNDIEDFVVGKNVFPVTPKVVDPEYLFMRITLDADYDATQVTGNLNSLKQDIINGVSNYFDTEVEDFGFSFHISRLLNYVDQSNTNVLGSDATIKLTKEFTDDGNDESFSGTFYNNPVTPETFVSNDIEFESDELDVSNDPIIYNVSLRAKSNGDILIGPFSENENITADVYETTAGGDWYEIGSIDGSTGEYSYNYTAFGLNRSRFLSGDIILTVVPVEPDIYVDRNVIVVFDYDLRPDYITVNLNPIVPRG